jgi:beta-galactosidase
VCGWKRPQSYFRDALWKPNQLSLFVKPPKPSFDTATFKKEDWAHWDWQDVVANWNWKGYENKLLQVEIYSSCEEVELFLNNHSLGKKPTNKSTKMMAVFNVPYQAGELKAIGYSNNKQVNNSVIKTADKPYKLKLIADKKIIKADGQDLSYITIEVQDNKNNLVPTAENLIQFKINGGTIVGVGNANPISTESCQQPLRKAWCGKALVIIKSNKKAGDIVLTVSSNGLVSTPIVIHSK